MPTNSMSPTIVGWHREVACPHCGGRALTLASDPNDFVRQSRSESESNATTCVECGKFGMAPRPATPPLGPDRIVANKLLAPQRWDVCVFRVESQDPMGRTQATKFVSRLVALPGETAWIEDGAIWIDGVKTPRPESIGKWSYTTTFEDGRLAGGLGTRDNPWKLGPGEGVFLGDFGWRSNDARYLGPTPMANVEGVVALRYWPPRRIEILR